MKAPILIERAFRGFHNRKVNLDWLKYTIFVIAVIAVVCLLVFTVVDSIRSENFDADKACAVAYGSTKWEHEEYDPNPNSSGDDMVKRCVNKETNEKKDMPKIDDKSKSGVSITIVHKDGQ